MKELYIQLPLSFSRIIAGLFFFTVMSAAAQSDSTYTDLRKALRSPEKVVHLDLHMVEMKKSDLKKLSVFKNLQSLNLSQCQLTEFPLSILSCTKLVHLDLSWNYITEVPETKGRLSLLEDLELYHNRFDSIPATMRQLIHLKQLSCAVTPQDFDEIILELPALQELRIYVKKPISPCRISELKALEDFHMYIHFVSDMTLPNFDCSTIGTEKLRHFSIYTTDCCWPYIELSEAQYNSIKKKLPKNCQLHGLLDGPELKSDIKLR
jgi:Leucine-rich repeat (LRR) protein